MSLKLVIGPANAEKARVALEHYRSRIDDAPLLVVPTFADVQAYRRELAGTGEVFGVEVVRFGWLLNEVARRAGTAERAASPLARERIAARAVARTKLEALGPSAATPGFSRALLALIAEFEELRLDPPRVTSALRRWAADEPGRRAYAEDVARLYAAYRDELSRLAVLDAQLRDSAALDALRLAPDRWGETPVVIYGFDDLTSLQRDTVETLACHAGADVLLTLTYEPGRTALAARARTFEELRNLPGTEVVELTAVAEHYAPSSREALHHLERAVFEPGDEDALFTGGGVPAGDALLLLEGGGSRAEVELVAAHVKRLLGDGWDPEEIAVVWRSPRKIESLVAEVFGAYEVPFSMSSRVHAGHTALGRGVVGLLRCALLDGTADDLLAYLRTPGLLERPGMADLLEAEARQTGARTAAKARALWEERHWPLDAIDRVAAAAERGPTALCERLARESAGLFARPYRGRAPILTGPERLDAAVAAALRGALGELGALARRDRALVPDPAELERVLSELEVFAGEAVVPGHVQVTSPFAIRARRVRALFLCGLNEGSFPAPARPDPLLSDDERAEINKATGLRLAHHRDQLAVERFLLYSAVSRPTELLALSWRTADDDGEPAVRSLFVDDVVDRFADAPLERLGARPLGPAGWETAPPTEREAARAAAAGGPRLRPVPLPPLSPDTVATLRPADRPWNPTEIEAWASCPIKWFVEKVLHPQELVPDPEALVRGRVAHEVLADVFGALDGRPLEPAALADARGRMHAALAREVAETPISVNRERLRAEVRRLEADLVRYLEFAAADGTESGPRVLEHKCEDVDLGPRRLSGRIDRVGVRDGDTFIVDYKGKTATPVARWIQDGKLQLGLYVLAARELARADALPGPPVGAIYQPLGAEDPRPRGMLLDDADPGRTVVSTDRLSPEEFEAKLAEVLAAAEEAIGQLRAGALEPRPDSCAWDGGCSYPTICRCDAV